MVICLAALLPGPVCRISCLATPQTINRPLQFWLLSCLESQTLPSFVTPQASFDPYPPSTAGGVALTGGHIPLSDLTSKTGYL